VVSVDLVGAGGMAWQVSFRELMIRGGHQMRPKSWRGAMRVESGVAGRHGCVGVRVSYISERIEQAKSSQNGENQVGWGCGDRLTAMSLRDRADTQVGPYQDG
jgi:hypothetical protein